MIIILSKICKRMMMSKFILRNAVKGFNTSVMSAEGCDLATPTFYYYMRKLNKITSNIQYNGYFSLLFFLFVRLFRIAFQIQMSKDGQKRLLDRIL